MNVLLKGNYKSCKPCAIAAGAFHLNCWCYTLQRWFQT